MFTSFAECRDDYVIQQREKGNQVSGDERNGSFQPMNKPIIFAGQTYIAHFYSFHFK